MTTNLQITSIELYPDHSHRKYYILRERKSARRRALTRFQIYSLYK